MLIKMLFRRSLLIALLAHFHIANGKSQIENATVYQQENTLFADVASRISLPKNVKEALLHGLTLTFNYEFQLKHNAWYKPSPVAKIKKSYLVSYQRMTTKFSIDNPVTLAHYEFDNLNDAKRFMQQLKAFPLILSSQLPNDVGVLAIRFHLSNHNLPAYVNIDRLFNDNWAVDSDWSYWKL